MNADRLLAHYDQIADAPDAITRLRRFILDLAVRGKLVPQDPDDEPASELLKRIAKEKARLVKAGEIREFAEPEAVAYEERPFDVPQSWEWVRLGDVLNKLTDGTHHSPPNGPIGAFKYITAKNIKDEGVHLEQVSYVSHDVHHEIFSRCNPEKGDILYIKDGATTGVVTVNDLDEPFSMLSSVALLKLPSCLFNRLVVYFLRSPFFYEQMRGFMKGAAITRVTLKRMGPALLPLPPLAEQHRIVAKIDELMGLCDRLEAARAGREATRDRLAAASLARLSTPDPETFRADARFALDALPALTTRPDQIKRLRQTILNLAVRGKLVPQDPNDEPASELLKRIAKEKARLVKAGEIKGEKASEGNNVSQLGVDLPPGWSAACLSEIAVCLDYRRVPINGTEREARIRGKSQENLFPYYGATQQQGWIDDYIFDGEFILLGEDGVPFYDPLRAKAYLVNGRSWVNNHAHVFRSILTVPIYLVHYLNVFDYTGRVVGATRPKLNQAQAVTIPVPLPPLAEQHRIVAKVEELLGLCDRLEASLTATSATRSRLLDALLAESLVEPESVAA